MLKGDFEKNLGPVVEPVVRSYSESAIIEIGNSQESILRLLACVFSDFGKRRPISEYMLDDVIEEIENIRALADSDDVLDTVDDLDIWKNNQI